MDHLEEELRRALARREPPAGFAERVQARAGRSRNTVRPRLWRWAMAAAACVLLLAGAARYQEQRRQERGEAAKARLMQALRITGSKLANVRAKVIRIDRVRLENHL